MAVCCSKCVYAHLALALQVLGGPNDRFFIYRVANLLQVSWNFQTLKLAWKVTKINSGKDGKGISCPCIGGV